MTCDELVRSVTVAVLAPTFGEVIFLVSFEHRETPDVVEITLTASASNERWFAPCSNGEARELSLNAHISRSVVESWISYAVFCLKKKNICVYSMTRDSQRIMQTS